MIFPEAMRFRAELEEEVAGQIAQREQATPACREPLSPLRGRRFSHLSLPRFRDLPQFAGSPARADAAFCVAALAAGMPEAEAIHALEVHYLSRDVDPRRRSAYILRTVMAARRYVVA